MRHPTHSTGPGEYSAHILHQWLQLYCKQVLPLCLWSTTHNLLEIETERWCLRGSDWSHIIAHFHLYLFRRHLVFVFYGWDNDWWLFQAGNQPKENRPHLWLNVNTQNGDDLNGGLHPVEKQEPSISLWVALATTILRSRRCLKKLSWIIPRPLLLLQPYSLN